MPVMILRMSAWSAALQRTYKTSQKRLGWVEQHPTKARQDAIKAANSIGSARRALDSWERGLKRKGVTPADRTQYAKANRAWLEVASAFYKGSTQLKTGRPPQLGIPPLVVGGVLLAAAAIAFAPSAWQIATSIRTEAETESRELDERVKASREGRILQDSTLDDDGGGGSSSMGLVIAGSVLLLLAGGVAVVVLSK